MMRLDPHQEEAVAWLLTHPRGGLADEMRVGKTAPTVVAAARAGARRVLVLCPAIARAVWREAVRDWYVGDAEWRILSYDQYASQDHARREDIVAWQPDTLILDECHYLKSIKAKRTFCLYGRRAAGTPLLEEARRVWLLSGTPCPNGPHELWTHFAAVFNDGLSYHDWLRRYCIFEWTEYGPRVTGVRDIALPELRAKFSRYFLRRTFREVHGNGAEPLRWNVVPLPAARLPKEARALTIRHKDLLVALRDAKTAAQRKRAMDALEEPLAALRRLTVDLKAELAVEHVRGYLEDPAARVLVLGYHREVLTRIAGKLGGVVLLGGTNDAERERVQREFQSGRAPVFCGQVRACGTAIDLSRATAVVFAETVWTPGDNVQAAMRAVHRDKEGTVVPVDVLVLEDSIDEAVERVKVRKNRMLAEVYDDGRTDR